MASRPPESEDVLISTTSEIFPDGIIDLVLRDIRTGPELLLWAHNKSEVAPQVKHEGITYRVPYLQPSVVRATCLPSGISDYGTTQQLIVKIERLLQNFIGLLTPTVHLLVLWVLSTWLADCVPSPPCLVVSGFNMGVGVRLFQILKCVIRRPLLLAEIHRAGFCSLMTPLHPTLLINHPGLSRTMRAFLRTSNFPGLVVPAGGAGVSDVSGPKAIFIGTDAPFDPWSESTLHVALLPASDSLPLLDPQTQHLIADEYLPELLLYRLRNVPKVLESMVPKDSSCPADADTFRACILDAPDFTQTVLPLLEVQREDAISQARLDPGRAIVEVLWTPTHEKADMSPTRIADLMNTLLRCRGEVREFTAEEVGWKLRQLGLYRERVGGGMVLRACRENSQRIHLLARRFSLDLPPVEGCPDCTPPAATPQSSG